jgi:hypothetical protein
MKTALPEAVASRRRFCLTRRFSVGCPPQESGNPGNFGMDTPNPAISRMGFSVRATDKNGVRAVAAGMNEIDAMGNRHGLEAMSPSSSGRI